VTIAFLSRHGVRTIVAFSAVGSLKEEIKPRDFVVPDQVIDRTKGIRPFTFFEGGAVAHVGFADPFDEGVAKVVRACGHSLEGDGVVLHDGGLLICMGTYLFLSLLSPHSIHYAINTLWSLTCILEGPQFSTRAESNLYRSWGGSVINMSCLPEAKLAREAEIAYQMICTSTDYDCWHSTAEDVTVEVVMEHMKANAVNARRFISAVLDTLATDAHAELVHARHLEGSVKFGVMTPVTQWNPEIKKKLNWLYPGYFE
jgi:5'-methylthioadenosine phosphorylase